MNETPLTEILKLKFPEEEKRICIEIEVRLKHMPEDTELQKQEKKAEFWRLQYYMERGMRKQAEEQKDIFENWYFNDRKNPIVIKEEVVYGQQREFHFQRVT
jgi:hypothetical protein|tara:strand:+ start:119 stop:424 length:306 start_codon:yes stop_codon:yes gene_type:complete